MRGLIAKRGSGSYAIALNLGRDPETGKRKQQWISVKETKKEAEKRLSESSLTFLPFMPLPKRIAKRSLFESVSAPFWRNRSRGLSIFGMSFSFPIFIFYKLPLMSCRFPFSIFSNR